GRDVVFLVDIDHGAPFGEPRAQLVIFGQTLAQAVETLGDGVARKAGQRLGTAIDLDARNSARSLDQIDQLGAVRSALADRLVIENNARDVVLHGVRRTEKKLAVVATAVLGRLHLDGVEALLDGAGAFVGGEDTLA